MQAGVEGSQECKMSCVKRLHYLTFNTAHYDV